MAVKVNNMENVRKAKRWNESDDAALCILLKRKIKDTDVSLRECSTPYERAKLKEHKAHYKQMLRKVEDGGYNGDIIFNELRAANALRGEQQAMSAAYGTSAGAKKYNSSYTEIDFDYESAFRKKRYYGVGLPIFLLIFSIVFVAVFVMAAFLPSNVMTVASESGIPLDSLFVYRLGEGALDIEIANDGNWPTGTFSGTAPEQGVPYEIKGNTPTTVKLFADLGMMTINISAFDIIKAWFHTPMLEKTRIDILEDSKYFQGTSYYYVCFMSGSKGDALKIQKDEDGNFDRSVIFRHIGTYGTILFVLLAMVLGVICIFGNICRLFTYTSRKVHISSLLLFLFALLGFISPALATMEGTDIKGAFVNYFMALTDVSGFTKSVETTVGVSILYFIPIGLAFFMMIFPKMFRNKLKKRPTYIPKGNRPRSAYNDPYMITEDTLRNIR